MKQVKQTKVVTIKETGDIPKGTLLTVIKQQYPLREYIVMRPSKFVGILVGQNAAVEVISEKEARKRIGRTHRREFSQRAMNRWIAQGLFAGTSWKVKGRGSRGGQGGRWYIAEHAIDRFTPPSLVTEG